jgi:TRAP-type C4-dicarboxylate transport system permease small subunit
VIPEGRGTPLFRDHSSLGARFGSTEGSAIDAIRFIHQWLGRLTAFVAGTILAAMTILVFLTVIYRYFLLSPISWGEEMARFMFIALAMLGAALAVKDRSHFTITILTSRFPAAMRAWLQVGIALGTSLLLGIVIAKGWSLSLLNQNQESPALGVPMSIPYSAVPVGATLMLTFVWLDLIIRWCEGRSADSRTETNRARV